MFFLTEPHKHKQFPCNNSKTPEEEEDKAYPADTAGYVDWQLLDFMAKLGFRYPITINEEYIGETYQLWSSQLTLNQYEEKSPIPQSKPWWRFWQKRKRMDSLMIPF